MAVPLLDLNAQNQKYANDLQAAFSRILGSSQFILGREVTSFEDSIASSLGSRHSIGVSSGTDALVLALMTIGIGPGDEVLCPSFTFFSTAGCISRLGAEPVFVDVLPNTFNINLDDAVAKISPRTKAIIPVHLYGQSADMDAVMELADFHGIKVVEDCAQAMGARWKNIQVGTIGDFGAYSFFPTKNLGGFGDGGLLSVTDPELAERARTLRVHGSKPKYYHKYVGGNFRLDALQAALLSVKLDSLESYINQRRSNAEYYHSQLSALGFGDKLMLPSEADNCRHTWNQFTLRIPEGRRDDLREHLRVCDIASEIYYPLTLHQQECFQNLPDRPCPVSEQLAGECLSIPIYPELTTELQDEVVFSIADFFKKLRN